MAQATSAALNRPLRTFDQACKDTGYNPTMFNCCKGWRLPDPSIYKVFEVRPCYDDNGYTQSCEYTPWEADFWTVYGARDASWTEWEAITDVSTEKLARTIEHKLHWQSAKARGASIVFMSTWGTDPDGVFRKLWEKGSEPKFFTVPEEMT